MSITPGGINEKGLKIIKDCEGLMLKAYLCPARIPTIGFGHTGPDITLDDVRNHKTITLEQAESLLLKDLAKFQKGVASWGLSLNENQFSALVSFAYNVGLANAGGSTLVRLIRQEKYKEAAAQFPRWNKAAGVILPGLTKRRALERALFETPV